MLSDNSTKSGHSERLDRFVETCADERLILLRPPYPMSMTHHWDWALQAGLRQSSAAHIVILTDRMMFKHDCLETLIAIVGKRPDEIISYAHDRVVDHLRPITVELSPWSDEVIHLSAAGLLALSSKGIFPWALPRLLNSVVPRGILEEIQSRYGVIVSSISPDYSFCYRALALVDAVAYWDRAPTVHYALEQSNGHSFSRGISSAASADFMSTIHGTIFARAPIPGIRTGGNAIIHEYCVARAESRSTKFPDIDLEAYTKLIREDIVQLENRILASDVEAQLKSWQLSTGRRESVITKLAGKESLVRRTIRGWGLGPRLLRHRQRWNVLVGRSPARRQFADADKALEYALSSNGERLPATRLSSLYASRN